MTQQLPAHLHQLTPGAALLGREFLGFDADGTTASMEGVAIVKGGPNNDSAKAFVDYINRKDVREMILKATFRRPTRSDVDLAKLPGDMPPMSAVKIIKYDEDGWTEKRAKTLEKIKDVLQDSR